MASQASNRREQLRRQQEAQARQKRTNRIIGISAGVLALVLVAVLAVVLVQGMAKSTPSTAAITPPNVNAAKNAIVVNPGKAAAGAPTLTLYLDYQCPNCRVFEENYGSMFETEGQAGTWTLEHKTMIFMDKNLSNTGSSRAAYAAACSDVSGHYAAYNREVYANQELEETVGSVGFSDQVLRVTIPATVGITGEALTAFQACYDNRATRAFVESVDKSAYTDGVTGTPTLAVNGKVLSLAKLTDATPAGLKAFILANV